MDTNLYPPIIASNMPSFLEKNAAEVLFSLTDFNDISEIDMDKLQVTLVNQNNNRNVLSDGNGIYFAKIFGPTLIGNKKYYSFFIPNELNENYGDSYVKKGWVANNIYKLQIRFTAAQKDGHPSTYIKGDKANWLSSNLDYFSEWSTVCLLKPIKEPTIQIVNINEEYSLDTLTVISSIDYHNENSKNEEYLSQYKIELLNDKGIVLHRENGVTDSFANHNEINTVLNYELINNTNYILKITYISNNGYVNSITKNFKCVILSGDTNIKIKDISCTDILSNHSHQIKTQDLTLNDLENARVRIELENTQDKIIIIRRSSSNTNFSIWEDIYCGDLHGENFYLDYSIEAGLFYKYRVYEYSEGMRKGPAAWIDELKNKPIMTLFDYIYLSDKDQQLAVKYDGQISSFKIVTAESITRTIGASYPYIKKEGNTYYRQFSISGIITSLMDIDNTFITNNLLYDENEELYNEYNSNNSISEYQNFVKEKLFREKVMEFLYNGKVKYFRSPSEGNLIIKLTDISLNPNQQLGRMIYSFSATVNEVADNTIDNLQQFNLIEEVSYE